MTPLLLVCAAMASAPHSILQVSARPSGAIVLSAPSGNVRIERRQRITRAITLREAGMILQKEHKRLYRGTGGRAVVWVGE